MVFVRVVIEAVAIITLVVVSAKVKLIFYCSGEPYFKQLSTFGKKKFLV